MSGGRLELGLIGRGAGRLPAGDVRLGFAAFAGRQQQVGMVEKPADTRGRRSRRGFQTVLTTVIRPVRRPSAHPAPEGCVLLWVV